MRCPLCQQRKGKRFCPAERSTICAQCCGEKRITEIDCPEGCEYLQAGRARETAQEYRRYLRSADPTAGQRYVRVVSNHEDVLDHLQLLVGEERRVSRDLTDNELIEALDLILATLRTEDSGVLYERTSNNLRVEGLRRLLSEVLRSHRYPAEPDRDRLPLKDAIDCLEVVRSLAASHVDSGTVSQEYVNFLAKNMPRVGRSTNSASRIIVPGQLR